MARTCTNCGRSEPEISFISSSGGWCVPCMASIDNRRIPRETSRGRYNRPVPTDSKDWNKSIYRRRYNERKAGVPEEKLTPLPR